MKNTAKTKIYSRQDELRAAALSLAEFCPVEGCNPEECPLYHVRKLEHTRRLQWLNALSEDDLVYLTAHHHVCMNIKLASKTFAPQL